MNAANLFDRNPLHVAHLQGPVDRLHDTNLRAIYERAGKILLIQRWKDLNTGAPHAFLLFESETAANSCCNRIGAPRITTPNNSHPQSITASILQPNQPNHPALQQWLSSQNMAPSYMIKNPPPSLKAAAFPLSCLRVLNEDASDVVGKLREFQCGPGWWRFVAQMYVANKAWAAARMVLKCEKEPDDDVIDISDDSAHEQASDDDQSGIVSLFILKSSYLPTKNTKAQKSSKPSTTPKASHNVWLPSKRDVTGARAKLGVVTSKPGAGAVKPGAAKVTKSDSSLEAPPFVPTPMSQSPVTDATPQASPNMPPTVPATLPRSTESGATHSKPSSSGTNGASATTNGPSTTLQPNAATKSTLESTPAQPSSSVALATSLGPTQAQLATKPPTSTQPAPASPKPASSETTSTTSQPIIPILLQPLPQPSSSRSTDSTSAPSAPTVDKPIPNALGLSSTGPSTRSSTEATRAIKTSDSPPKATGPQDAPSKSTTPAAPKRSTRSKSGALPTGPKSKSPPTAPKALISSVNSKSATPPTGPKSTTPSVSTPTAPRSLAATLSGQKAPPTGPRALTHVLGTSSTNLLSASATTAPGGPTIAPSVALTSGPHSSRTSSTLSINETAPAPTSLTTPQSADPSTVTPRQAHTSSEPPAVPQVKVKKEAEQVTLGNQPSDSVSQGSSIAPISRNSPTAPPAEDSSMQEASPAPTTENTPSVPITQEQSSTTPAQDPPSTQTTQAPPTEEPSVAPMEEDSFSTPTEGDSSFGVPSEDLFPLSIAPTEDTSSIILPQDLSSTQNRPTALAQDSASGPPAQDPPTSTIAPPSTTSTASHGIPARTPIRSPSREPLSFFGISSSPGSLLVALPPTSSSPTKRKSDTFETRLIKRRRHRTSSSKSEPIIVEPEISALEAEKARAAELQAEEDRVRELLGVDMSDYAESVMARLSGSDKTNGRGIISSSDKSKSSPAQGTPVESDLELELRSLRATRDENEALKMKIKVLELTLPTAESVKNELYAERKEKSQLIEALAIERSLLTQSEALRKQSDATREGLQKRVKQLEERLSESTVTLEKAREAAQTASDQRRKAEEACSVADAERTKLEGLLDEERGLVSRERAALAEESNVKAEAQAKLAAAEARLAAEQRRYAEAMDQTSKERIEAKNFLDAEKAIVSAQEAKLEREKEIRGELETKLREVEDRLKEEQAKRVEDKRIADCFLQEKLTMAMKLVTAEREVTGSERAKTVAEAEARGLAEKEVVLLKERLETSEKALKEALDGYKSMKRDLTTFKDQLNDSERRERTLRTQLSTVGTKLGMTEDRVRATEDRAAEVEQVSQRQVFELSKIQAELASEKNVLLMERQALALERMARKELERKMVTAEERVTTGAKQLNELQVQLQNAVSSSQGTREQLQTQRTLLHIARTRIQELEQAIQRVESDLDAARTGEATAKTMIQLWGPPPRAQLSSPISDIVEQQVEQMDTEDPFISLMKPHRQQSFKLKRTAAPARLLKVDMPSGEPANIDLGGLPANPEAIIDLLYRSKCAGVFWDIIMDEYGAMGCFDAAEAIAEGKLRYQP